MEIDITVLSVVVHSALYLALDDELDFAGIHAVGVGRDADVDAAICRLRPANIQIQPVYWPVVAVPSGGELESIHVVDGLIEFLPVNGQRRIPRDLAGQSCLGSRGQHQRTIRFDPHSRRS